MNDVLSRRAYSIIYSLRKYSELQCLGSLVLLKSIILTIPSYNCKENAYLVGTVSSAKVTCQEFKIVNGSAAEWNNTRQQVSLRNSIKDSYVFGSGHLGGGSLISENIKLVEKQSVDSKGGSENEANLPDILIRLDVTIIAVKNCRNNTR
ncbi:hypothetical protein GQX74_010105 [Glossina fuscipes]|nr:hypothetical protein GQX74_010105 [Glossina fuscipes]